MLTCLHSEVDDSRGSLFVKIEQVFWFLRWKNFEKLRAPGAHRAFKNGFWGPYGGLTESAGASKVWMQTRNAACSLNPKP